MSQEKTNKIRPSIWIFTILSGAIILIITLMLPKPGNEGQQEKSIKPGQTQLTDNTNQASDSSNFLNRVKQIGNSRQQKNIHQEAPDLTSIQDRLNNALNINNQSVRHQLLAELGKDASGLDSSSASELAEMIAKNKNQHTQQNLAIFTTNYLTEKAKSNPEHAAHFAENLPKEARPYAYSSLIEEWAKSDVASASQWASNIPEEALRNAAISSIGEFLKLSPDSIYASEWATNLGETIDGSQHAGMIAAIRSRTDPQGVFDWAMGLPTPESRASAFGGFAEALVELDPVLAKEWIQQFPLEEGIREHGQNKMAYKWMQSDPVAATDWSVSETPHAPGVGSGE